MSKISPALAPLVCLISALASALALLSAPVAATSTDLASDPNFACSDIKLVFARHSGADLNERNYQAYVQAFQDTFSGSGLSISSYELGSHPGGYAGFSYPSPGIGLQTWERFTTSLGAVVSAGNSYAFGDSVKEGASEAEFFITNYKQLCPTSKVVLAGFSQGAQVVSLTLQKIDPNDLFRAYTFGDPKLYLPEGTPSGVKTSSRACREGRITYSHYRAFVPDCYVYEGVLGGYRPYDPYLASAPEKTPAENVPLATPELATSSPYLGKIKAYCQHHDVICSSYVDFVHFAYGHASYLEQGRYTEIAQDAYNAVFPPAPGESEKYEKPIQNVALLVDNTDSMSAHVAYYRSVILSTAKKYLESGAKLALYSFRDLATSDPSYPDTPRSLCDFSTCSMDSLPELLDSLYFTSGGDDPESVLSSAYTLMKELSWTPGANKSVIVFTDNSFHTPDLDGITMDDVVALSESIDPVNLYFFVPTWEINTYRELADRTAGGVFAFGQPDRFLELNQEIANRLGDYGMFTETPALTVTEVTSLTAEAPGWYDLTSNNLPTSGLEAEKIKKIAFSVSPDVRRLILTVNEEISGYYDLEKYYANAFLLTDIDPSRETKVCLSPISLDGYRSAPTCIILGADESSETPSPENPDPADLEPENPETPASEETSQKSSEPEIIIPKAPNTGFSR